MASVKIFTATLLSVISLVSSSTTISVASTMMPTSSMATSSMSNGMSASMGATPSLSAMSTVTTSSSMQSMQSPTSTSSSSSTSSTSSSSMSSTSSSMSSTSTSSSSSSSSSSTSSTEQPIQPTTTTQAVVPSSMMPKWTAWNDNCKTDCNCENGKPTGGLEDAYYNATRQCSPSNNVNDCVGDMYGTNTTRLLACTDDCESCNSNSGAAYVHISLLLSFGSIFTLLTNSF